MTKFFFSCLHSSYSPALYYLRDMHDYKQYEDGMDGGGGGVRIEDPPDKQYQTVALQVRKETTAQPALWD